jgi:hypothetical protein
VTKHGKKYQDMGKLLDKGGGLTPWREALSWLRRWLDLLGGKDSIYLAR